MGLIIKGTVPSQGFSHHFPYDTIKDPIKITWELGLLDVCRLGRFAVAKKLPKVFGDNLQLEISLKQMSHEKYPLTFHYTGCLIGILIMVY